MNRIFKLELIDDCFSFCLRDAISDAYPEWTEHAGYRLLAVARATIGVGTISDSIVNVSLEFTVGVPDEDMTSWDQVNECSINLPSGRLSVGGGTWVTPTVTVEVDPGTYRARIYYGNLDPLKPKIPDLKDCYRVVLWQADVSPLEVLKQMPEETPREAFPVKNYSRSIPRCTGGK